MDTGAQGEHHTMTEAEAGVRQLRAQARQGLTASTPSWEEERQDSPLQVPAHTLILDFQTPEQQGKKFLLF